MKNYRDQQKGKRPNAREFKRNKRNSKKIAMPDMEDIEEEEGEPEEAYMLDIEDMEEEEGEPEEAYMPDIEDMEEEEGEPEEAYMPDIEDMEEEEGEPEEAYTSDIEDDIEDIEEGQSEPEEIDMLDRKEENGPEEIDMPDMEKEGGSEERHMQDIRRKENGTEKMQMPETKDQYQGNGKKGVISEEISKGAAPKTVILQVEHNNDDDLEEIDLVNVAGYMGQKWKFYAYLLVVVVCIGFAAAVVSMFFQKVLGGESSATAVVSFNFDGIDKGLDPNGGLFDVTKLKSTEVVNMALSDLGWDTTNVESIRANISITGVIPESVKQKISVINTVAEDATEYLTNIEDVDYFPSRYTVTLKRCDGMDGQETTELLDAILYAYQEYFMDTYASMATLGMATEVIDVEGYDYLQASDMIKSEMDTMQNYVDAKADEAPNFRASSTGLSFSDLSSAINAVRRLDMSNFVSFVRTNNLTKDAGLQIDYYNYQIEQYNLDIQELQTQLSNVERTIDSYEKDPMIVVSNQDSVLETTTTNDYYNNLLAQKLSLSRQISELNTELNEAYTVVNALNTGNVQVLEADYTYADSLLEGLLETVQSWAELVKQTTEEYFEADLYADAYRIAIPAQYSTMGSLSDLIKRMLLFGGIGGAVVVVLWGISGLKDEIKRSRVKAAGGV